MDKTEFQISINGVESCGFIIFDGLLDAPKFIPDGFCIIGKKKQYKVISGPSLPDGFIAIYEYTLEA